MRYAPAFALLALAAAAPAQEPGRPAGLDAYRDHLLTAPAPDPRGGSVRVTFLGAATLLFDDGETKFMTDGFLTRPPPRQVLGAIRTDPKTVAAALEKAGAEKLAALFVAHSHYDHALDCAHVARATGATLYGSASTLNVGRGGEVPDDRMVRFEAGKEYAVGRFTVAVLAAKHSPPIRWLNDDLGQTIDRPLRQPAGFRDYKEGGAFDFLVAHGPNAVLVNAGGSFVEGSRAGVRAGAVFLSTGALDRQPAAFQNRYYDETVGAVRPRLVVPIHWDNFLAPLSDRLDAIGDPGGMWDVLIRRCRADGVRFGVLQGYGRVTLFGDGK